MNIKQVKYFVGAVDKGSLSAAAKDLYVTVQAISKAIANLETELGGDLLERGCRGVKPTEYGMAFYQRALDAITCFDELEVFSQTYRSREAGESLCLGLNTPPFNGNEQLRESVAQLVESQMGCRTSMELAMGERGFANLRGGALDALITLGSYRHPDVRCETVGMLAPAAMMRKSHPLAKQHTVSLADLEPYIVADPTWFSDSNRTIASLYRERSPRLAFASVDLENITDHMFNRDGIILTTGIEVMAKMHLDTAIIPLAPDDTMLVPVCLVSMEKRISPMLTRLYQVLLGACLVISRGKGPMQVGGGRDA